MKSRLLKSEIIEKNRSPIGRIIVLTGARQTGKTTLARNSFPDYTYLSIEDPVLRTQYSELTAAQWSEYYPNSILDEVQKMPQLIESIKSVYDQYPEPRYLLLGSSQLLLMQKVKESLAGRCFIQEVFPLTLPELLTESWDMQVEHSIFQKFITSKQLTGLYPSFSLDPKFAQKDYIFNYYLKNGGYPALVNKDLTDNDRFEWLKMYVKTYLERDIRDLADFKSLQPFVKVQQITSLLTAQQLNYTNLAKEAGISSNTAQRFIQYLEISYQTVSLQPWFKNNLKRLSKTPKLHYLDPGIQRAIIQKQGMLTGNEFESAIIAEMYKQLKNIRFKGNLFHFRTHDGREIDLLIETEDGYIPIEIKMTNNVNRTDARHLFSLDEIMDKPIIHSFVLSNDNTIKQLSEKITAIPAALFLT